jgi:methyl-accepting chemotaxis protein
MSKISTKLLVVGALLVLTSVIVGLLGATGLSSARDDASLMYEKLARPFAVLTTMVDRLQGARVETREMLLVSTPDQIRAQRDKALAQIDAFESASAEFERTLVQEQGKRDYAAVVASERRFRTFVERLSGLLLDGRRDDALRYRDENSGVGAEVQQGLVRLADSKLNLARETHARTEARVSSALAALVGASLVSLALAMWLWIWSSKTLVAPLKRVTDLVASGDVRARLNLSSQDEIGQMARAFDELADRLERKTSEAEAIARGDLTVEIAMGSGDDALGRAFEAMRNELENTLRKIQQSFGHVTTGASEISDASQSLSQGATEQASSIEEISSSVTQIGSQARSSADNAGQANRLVVSAREAAEKGDEQMKLMVSAMNEINAASAQIGKIIKVIDDIAFQTNLLALNAAVEAARAGKHGKGFAVVAEEVRNLAGRSAKAARETAEMIETAMRRVENGIASAHDTSEVFGQILQSVIKTADLVGEIAAAGSEQAHSITQISQGLGQIDQVTQRSTASAEELASSAQELATNATHANEMLRRFRIRGGEDGPPAPMHSPAPALLPARKRSASVGGNGNTAWGNPPPAPLNGVDPASVISLDDKDFGRY